MSKAEHFWQYCQTFKKRNVSTLCDYNTFLFMQIFLWHNKRQKNVEIKYFSILKIMKDPRLNNHDFIFWNISTESYAMFFLKNSNKKESHDSGNAKPVQTCLINEWKVQLIVIWMMHPLNLVCWPSSKMDNCILLTW